MMNQQQLIPLFLKLVRKKLLYSDWWYYLDARRSQHSICARQRLFRFGVKRGYEETYSFEQGECLMYVSMPFDCDTLQVQNSDDCR